MQIPESLSRRVLIETLRQSKDSLSVSMDVVANRSRVSTAIVEAVLSNASLLWVGSEISVLHSDRFRLAMAAASNDSLGEVAKALRWQEFELFAEECLRLAGFEARRNVRVKDEKRGWQIDVVGAKPPLVLSIDCKHWKPPNYPSKFKKASAHQKTATAKLLNAQKYPTVDGKPVGLPVILTLHEPNSESVDGVVLLPVQKLPDFLSNITPFTPGLPFLYPKEDPVQNPIIAVPLPSGD